MIRMVFVASTVHTSLKNMKFMFVVSKKKNLLWTFGREPGSGRSTFSKLKSKNKSQ
jgi:hypothetical protein